MARAHRRDGRGPARPRDIRNGFNRKLLSTSARPRVHGSGFVGSNVASMSARVAAEAGSSLFWAGAAAVSTVPRVVPLVLYAPCKVWRACSCRRQGPYKVHDSLRHAGLLHAHIRKYMFLAIAMRVPLVDRTVLAAVIAPAS